MRSYKKGYHLSIAFIALFNLNLYGELEKQLFEIEEPALMDSPYHAEDSVFTLDPEVFSEKEDFIPYEMDEEEQAKAALPETFEELFPEEEQAALPETLPESTPVEEVVALPDNKSEDPSQTCIQKLEGIVLTGDSDRAGGDFFDETQGIKVESLNLPGKPASLFRQLQPYLGKCISKADILEIKKIIIRYYQDSGYPIVSVRVPQQDVTHGVLQLLVTQGRLGKVTVSGNKWSNSKRLMEYIQLKPNGEINEDLLMQNVDFINRNPFRRVDVIYAPGEGLGLTDVELVVHENRPYRFYAGVDNTGVQDTGSIRWYVGANWGNVFGTDQQISYQYTFNSDVNNFSSQTGNWTIPLPWEDVLVFFGGYSKVEAELSAPGCKNKGNSAQASARYDLLLKPFNRYLHEILLGFDWKRTNNNIEFTSGPPIVVGNTNLSQFIVGYNLGYDDKINKLAADAEIIFSPGHMLPNATEADYNALRPGADPLYLYTTLALSNITRIPLDFSFSFLFRGQYAAQVLLPSELFGIGGYNTVRGYYERQVNTDNGFILSGEFRSPPISFMTYNTPIGRIKDALQFLVFADYGYGINKHNNEGGPSPQYLIGIGPGVRYDIIGYLALRLDWGFKLHRDGYPGGPTRLHFGVTASY